MIERSSVIAVPYTPSQEARELLASTYEGAGLALVREQVLHAPAAEFGQWFHHATAAIDKALAKGREALRIALEPPCFACGAKVTQRCERAGDKHCGREHSGGTREALLDNGSTTKQEVKHERP